MRTRPLLRLAAGLAATASLAILVLGVPAGLVYWQHNPLPHTLPGASDLNHPMTLDAIARCVAVLLWIAWLQFALAVAAEVRYQWPRRHQAHGTRQPGRGRHLALTGPSGSLAGRLVALALLLTTASAAILPSASAATAAHASAAPTRHHTVAAAPARPTSARTARAADSTSTESDAPAASSVAGIPVGARYYTVAQTDSLWRIAEECLGDGSRYGEIYQLNHGRTQPDGRALTERSLIQPGWHLIVPADAAGCPLATAHPGTQPHATAYTVVAGNTLTGIAGTEYHDPADWPLIYDANRTTVHNPDLIYPGQVLEIPALPGQATASAPAAGARPASPATGRSAATKTGTSSKSTAPSGATGHTGTQPSTAVTASPSPSASTGPAAPRPAATDGAARTPASADPTHVPARAGVAAAEVSGQRAIWELLGIGGLAAAAAVTALDLRRRRQQRARREGEYIKLPGSGPLPTTFEMQLRSGNDEQTGAWLSQVLRAAAANAAATGRELPDLRVVSLGADALYIQPAQPTDPVAPFAAAEDWWVCPRTCELPAPAALAEVRAPYPALVTAGHDEHGRAILVDLESIRSLAVPGPASLGALRAIALELLGQISADQLTVTLVGVGAELASAGLPASLNLAADLDTSIDALADGIEFAAGRLDASGAPNVRAARVAGHVDAPVAHVLISAEEPTPAQSERLSRLLAAAPAVCAAVVTAAPLPVVGAAWVLPATGAPEILAPTGISVQGQYLTDDLYAQLIEHLDTSGDLESTPDPQWVAPPRSGAEAAEEPADVDDEWIADPEYYVDGLEVGTFERETLETKALDTPQEPALLAPAGKTRATGRLAPFPGAAPAHATARPVSAAPRVLLLGPIELVGARGSVEPSRASRLRELAAFIVLNRDSTATHLVEAVWPNGTTQGNKDTSVNKLRHWLGRDDAGKPYFPNAHGGYRLAPGVECDLLEFEEHYQAALRARADGAIEQAAASFEAGLALVRGRPFAGAESKRYGWAEPALQKAVSEIVDSVRHLARIRMAEGDWMAAATIAAWGMGIGPEHEILFRLRFEAVYRMGDQRELDRLCTVLQARLDDAGMSMQDETKALLEEMLDRRTASVTL
ncbi:LysM peptidoglycan-binding domain-containing protein [Actinospica sp. MGRD01-02]|uniref:LysM peptidoglycan-binding domain-containing protein n=1 Tax=Actinospica acidithermotolerans TaxID=2828514 RepID=A0A941EGR0_9ACTN|nr:BTAD domain-containing putative transcriptional regulator [Actinospica acidithermotolerans]MBR7828774.1 LysM peptidoglycan-binding domain-containing protein [Actinospica acidithermotolerans]